MRAMSRTSTLMLIGLLIGLVPFSGLPQSWLEFILPALGLIIVGIAYTMRPHKIPTHSSSFPDEVSTAA
jgi:hypothetical protein